MQVGTQEKTAFVQAFQKPALTGGAMRLPAYFIVLVLVTGMAVLVQHSSRPSLVTSGIALLESVDD